MVRRNSQGPQGVLVGVVAEVHRVILGQLTQAVAVVVGKMLLLAAQAALAL